MNRYTIFGHNGFIGSYLKVEAQNRGYDVILPDYNEIPNVYLGNIIYAAGVTGDFFSRPSQTVNAHVCLLNTILQKGDFRSICYLSSTRVYGNNTLQKTDEETPLMVHPQDPSDLYNLSKLMGESICLTKYPERTKIVRISNVFGLEMGDNSFLGNIFSHISANKEIVIHDYPESCKDYIFVQNVCTLLFDIVNYGKNTIYNVASGRNVTHNTITETLRKMGKHVSFSNTGSMKLFPVIDNKKIILEFHPNFYPIEMYIQELIISEKIDGYRSDYSI